MQYLSVSRIQQIAMLFGEEMQSVYSAAPADWATIYLYARGVIVIVVGNEHGDTSSNPGQD